MSASQGSLPFLAPLNPFSASEFCNTFIWQVYILCAIYTIVLSGQLYFELSHTRGVCLYLPTVAVNSHRMGLYGMLFTSLHADLHSVQGLWEVRM